MSAAPKSSPEELWAALVALPPHLKGEIIDGELHVQPRPRFRHARATGFFGHHLGGTFDYDEGGPGGWWIVPEPGIGLPGAPEISPDVAGWRHETMAHPPDEGEPIRVVPDWACEVLSPSNARYDKRIKVPFYARVGLPWLWLVDTRDETIEVLELSDGAWRLHGVFSREPDARIPPFAAIELPLHRLWVPNERESDSSE